MSAEVSQSGFGDFGADGGGTSILQLRSSLEGGQFIPGGGTIIPEGGLLSSGSLGKLLDPAPPIGNGGGGGNNIACRPFGSI